MTDCICRCGQCWSSCGRSLRRTELLAPSSCSGAADTWHAFQEEEAIRLCNDVITGPKYVTLVLMYVLPLLITNFKTGHSAPVEREGYDNPTYVSDLNGHQSMLCIFLLC